LNRFAFVLHPISVKDAARKYPIAKYLPDRVVEAGMARLAPKVVSQITGIKAANGAEATGVFIGLPLTPRQMIETLPLEQVYEKIVRCAEIAAAEGAKIIGLGAFTSVVGDGGVTVAARSPIAVTTGNSYTVATDIQGTLQACDLLGILPQASRLAVVGATGSIGKTCASVLAPSFSSTVLVGRDEGRTSALASELPRAEATTLVEDIREADVVVTVTSSDAAIILPSHLKAGSVVCDVARPRDVSVRVAKERNDVLVIEGGVVAVPGDVDFGFNFGFPPKTAYACMAETMMLALESRYENFTLGKDVSVEQVEETIAMADRLGFKLAGFRSFERAVDDAAIQRVREARERAGAYA